MGYGKKINLAAVAELERRRDTAESTANARLEEFYSRCPQARSVKEALAENASNAVRSLLKGGNVREEVEKLRENAAELDREYDRLLKENGFTRSDITPKYSCNVCKDTGFVDGKMCSCLKQLRRSIAYRELCMDVPLESCTFDDFSLDMYKDDEKAYSQMEKIFSACKSYAQKFRETSPSLLFHGGTGLGKTHLSLAIAGEALAKGFGVIYGSAQSFAISLEKERFEHQDKDDPEDTRSQLISCDLLIMDDLGVEFPSNYVNAGLYDIINSRLMAGKPTIISTNLTTKELEARYGERFASRIVGSYGQMKFMGRDIRVAKRSSAAKRKQ